MFKLRKWKSFSNKSCRNSVPILLSYIKNEDKPIDNYEAVAKQMRYVTLFSCCYSPHGCSRMLRDEEKYDHEDSCVFRQYRCPNPTLCYWEGPLERIVFHMMMDHDSINTAQGEEIVFNVADTSIPGPIDWVLVQSCFGQNFLIIISKQDRNDDKQQFSVVVQFIGSKKDAEKFMYKLVFRGNSRRFTWQASPCSIGEGEGFTDAKLRSDCFRFDTTIAELFAEKKNPGLTIKIKISLAPRTDNQFGSGSASTSSHELWTISL